MVHPASPKGNALLPQNIIGNCFIIVQKNYSHLIPHKYKILMHIYYAISTVFLSYANSSFRTTDMQKSTLLQYEFLTQFVEGGGWVDLYSFICLSAVKQNEELQDRPPQWQEEAYQAYLQTNILTRTPKDDKQHQH